MMSVDEFFVWVFGEGASDERALTLYLHGRTAECDFLWQNPNPVEGANHNNTGMVIVWLRRSSVYKSCKCEMGFLIRF